MIEKKLYFCEFKWLTGLKNKWNLSRELVHHHLKLSVVRIVLSYWTCTSFGSGICEKCLWGEIKKRFKVLHTDYKWKLNWMAPVHMDLCNN